MALRTLKAESLRYVPARSTHCRYSEYSLRAPIARHGYVSAVAQLSNPEQARREVNVACLVLRRVSSARRRSGEARFSTARLAGGNSDVGRNKGAIIENLSTELNIPPGAKSEGTVVRKYWHAKSRFEVTYSHLGLAARGLLAIVATGRAESSEPQFSKRPTGDSASQLGLTARRKLIRPLVPRDLTA
jgi:hypothetical protein